MATSTFFLPLLETKAGQVYLQTGTNSIVDFDTFNGFTPTGAEVLKAGGVSFSANSDPTYQGRMTLSYVGSSIQLNYNGNNWSAGSTIAPAAFSLGLDYKDIAWATVGTGEGSFDLFPITPVLGGGAPPLAGSNWEWAGGSEFVFQVIPLIMPTVASVSPSVISTSGTQTITVTLVRPLNPVQNPTVTFSGTGLTVSGGVVANKNSYGSITGWTFTATAVNTSPTIQVVMSASENLQYLKGDVIVTEMVTYMTNVSVGSPVTVSTPSVAPTVSSFTVTAPDTYGWTDSANGSQGFSGRITVSLTVASNTNNFSSASIIAMPGSVLATEQQAFKGTRITLGAGIPNGQPYTGQSAGGDLVYYQDYTLVVDTGVVFSSAGGTFLGASVSTTDQLTTNFWSSIEFFNCNPTQQFTAYSLVMTDISGDSYTTKSGIGQGIPITTWQTDVNNVYAFPSTPPSFYNQVGWNFYVQEVWSYAGGGLDSILRAELRNGTTNAVIATTTTRSADPLSILPTLGPLYFPNVNLSSLGVGTSNIYIRLYSKATSYTFSGVGYIDTPLQPLTMTSNSNGGGGGAWIGGCFTPETYIMTVDGPKKIANVNIGDLLLTVSDADFTNNVANSLKPYKVTDKLIHQDAPYHTLNINGILTTNEHLWATSDAIFDRADAIKKTVVVDLQDQSLVTVAAITIEGPVVPLVMNLTVETAHTFLVSPSMFGPWTLVHNMKSESLYL